MQTAVKMDTNEETSSTTAKTGSAFRTISEVADKLGVQQHVLRFWETKFSQIRPMKRGGGRRYYRPEDVALLEHIHNLLYTQGYTIKGAQNLLKGQSKGSIAAAQMAGKARISASRLTPITSSPIAEEKAQPNTSAIAAPSNIEAPQAQAALPPQMVSALEAMLEDLKSLRALVNN